MNGAAENIRKIHLKNIPKKGYAFFKGTETVWNENSRLAPKFLQYSAESHKFKRWPRDLSNLDEEERMDQYQSLMQVVIKSKADSQSRHKQRKLEREVVSLTFLQIYIIAESIPSKARHPRCLSYPGLCN